MDWYKKISSRINSKYASGILFRYNGKVFLQLRSDKVEDGGKWGVPGGSFDQDDSNINSFESLLKELWKSALREVEEEVGYSDDFTEEQVNHALSEYTINNYNDIVYVTFEVDLTNEQAKKMEESIENQDLSLFAEESDDNKFFDSDELPSNIHPGLKDILEEKVDITSAIVDVYYKYAQQEEVGAETLFKTDDEKYLEAVNNGDIKTAQMMVDEAAKRAGYTVKAHHGTDATPFSVFESRGGVQHVLFSSFGVDRQGFFFTQDLDVAKSFGDRVMNVVLNPGKIADLTKLGTADELAIIKQGVSEKWLYQTETWALFDEVDGVDFVKAVRAAGFDSVRIDEPFVENERNASETLVMLKPSQIKSADPVTYDDAGNIIPLSKRFDTGDDIRGDVMSSNVISGSVYLLLGERLAVNTNEILKTSSRTDDEIYLEAVRSGDMDKAKKMVEEKIRQLKGAKTIPFITSGDYRKGKELRDLAHGIKEGNYESIKRSAEIMAPLVPQGAILLPVPSSSGFPTTTMELANEISKLSGTPVFDVLRDKNRESHYKAKKSGRFLSIEDMGIYLTEEIPSDVLPVFIDNVIATGTTSAAAFKAVGRGIMLALAYDSSIPPVDGLSFAKTVVRDNDGNIIPLSQRFMEVEDSETDRQIIPEKEKIVDNFDKIDREVKNLDNTSWYDKSLMENTIESSVASNIKTAADKWTVGQVFVDDNGEEYDVDMLQKITKDNQVQEISVDKLKNQLNEDAWGGTGEEKLSPMMVLKNPTFDHKHINHMSGIRTSDLDFPILIRATDFKVIDGYHRLARAFLEKHGKIKAVIIQDEQMKKARIGFDGKEYQRPYDVEKVKKEYPELLKDPVHFWRAKTGIELIHQEPDKEEFLRIVSNWEKMDDNMKEKSDQKSVELFGKNNRDRIPELLSKY